MKMLTCCLPTDVIKALKGTQLVTAAAGRGRYALWIVADRNTRSFWTSLADL